jgi:outer membrane immunogenic protein
MLKIILAGMLIMLGSSAVADEKINWEGYYVGGGIGFSHGSVSEGKTDWIENGITPYITSGKNSEFNHMLLNMNAGYNVQLDNKSIIGFEVDNNYVNQTAHGDVVNYDISYSTVADRVVSKTKINNIQTLRLKYGFDHKNVYYYLTGGLALAEVKRKVTGLDDNQGWAFLDFGETNSKTNFETGYALGAGMEMPVRDSLSFSLKYIYTDFGDINYNYEGHAFGAINIGKQKVKLDNSMLSVGLNYHF